MEKLSYPELTEHVRAYFKRNSNQPMTSAEVFEDQFSDQDKVRFQLVFSNMALKPPHEMVKLLPSVGTRGAKWRLREPSDPPFAEPVKATRAKRTVEIDRPLASTASTHASRVSHRSIGNVAETPPEVRAREVNESIPVEHHSLSAPPPNNALATAMARAAKASPVPARNVPVAAFKDQKELKYEIAPDAKLTVIPRGASGMNPIYGAVELPRHKVEADTQPPVFEAKYEPPVEFDLKAVASNVRRITEAAFGPKAKLPEPEEELPAVTVPFGTLQSVPQSPGQILDLLISTVGPMFKSMITDAVKEALHAHAQVQITGSSQAPAVEIAPAGPAASVDQAPAALAQTLAPAIHAAISVPPLDPPKPIIPKHKPVMPQDAVAMMKTRLPKVTVVGLPKPQWAFDVKERFAKWLDIRNVNADARGKTARDWCKGSDHVIVMVDYNSHSMEQALKAPPSIPYDRLSGGPGKLDEYLREIIKSYSEKESASA